MEEYVGYQSKTPEATIKKGKHIPFSEAWRATFYTDGKQNWKTKGLLQNEITIAMYTKH